MASVFFSYSHADEALRDQLEKQLAALKRQGVIETWHDRRIGAGEEFASAIDHHVETDDIILLLVSADFIASDYCYDIEMKRAMERHQAREAIVIPVILRACDWHGTPFGRLNATPPDGKPITQFADRDQAMLEVAKAVREAAEKADAGRSGRGSAPRAVATPATPAAPTTSFPNNEPAGPRSSNLALAKTFSEKDRDAFRRDSFDYMSRFFENSLAEIATRNPGVEGDFRRVDADRFVAAVYLNGKAVSRCSVFVGDRHFARGIAYSHGDTSGSNSFNELISVDADDRSMFLRSMGMSSVGGRAEAKLTQEGAAEHYWALLVRPLQQR